MLDDDVSLRFVLTAPAGKENTLVEWVSSVKVVMFVSVDDGEGLRRAVRSHTGRLRRAWCVACGHVESVVVQVCASPSPDDHSTLCGARRSGACWAAVPLFVANETLHLGPTTATQTSPRTPTPLLSCRSHPPHRCFALCTRSLAKKNKAALASVATTLVKILV
jgi:hypothetical protein